MHLLTTPILITTWGLLSMQNQAGHKKKISDLNTRFMCIIFSAHISTKLEINNQDKALQLIQVKITKTYTDKTLKFYYKECENQNILRYYWLDSTFTELNKLMHSSNSHWEGLLYFTFFNTQVFIHFSTTNKKNLKKSKIDI